VTLEYNDERLAPPYVGPLSPDGDVWPSKLVRVQGHGWNGTVWINETRSGGTMANESSMPADEFNAGQMLVGWQEAGRYRYTFDNLAGCRSAFEIDVGR
jgi:hypothetical protein